MDFVNLSDQTTEYLNTDELAGLCIRLNIP
jgi:hypothetical protein